MSDLAELKQAVAALQLEVTRLNDQAEVTKLQYKYGYYLDKCLYKEVSDLFSDHPDAYVDFMSGRYKRKAGVERLYIGRFAQRFVKGRNGPIHGFLLDHAQLQGIVDIVPPSPASNNMTIAHGRFRTLMSAGVHQSVADSHPRGFCQWWEGGLYENQYIKEDGTWKIFKLKYYPFWHADFEKGWGKKEEGQFVPVDTVCWPESQVGPDELVGAPMLWPDTRVVPFHYRHPVTGKDVCEEDLRAPGFGEGVENSLAALMLD